MEICILCSRRPKENARIGPFKRKIVQQLNWQFHLVLWLKKYLYAHLEVSIIFSRTIEYSQSGKWMIFANLGAIEFLGFRFYIPLLDPCLVWVIEIFLIKVS